MKSFIQKGLVTAVLLALFAAPRGYASDLSSVESRNDQCHLKIVWGIWPPYQYFGADGTVTGLQIDLINQILERAGCGASYVQQPFHLNVISIKEGTADMMADITPTEERAQFAWFSVPYRKENLVLYVNKTAYPLCTDGNIESLLEKGFRLGLTLGNYYGEAVEKIKRNADYQSQLVFLRENEQGTDELLSGRIDGFFEDPTVMAYKLRQRGLRNEVKSCHIVVSGASVSFMFSKRRVNKETIERINRAIEEVKQTTSYKRRWQW